MDPVATLVKSSIPNYLSNLPIPNSFVGWFKLGVKDWAQLVPFFTVIGGISYCAYRTVKPKGVCIVGFSQGQAINPCIRKDEAKVVDIINIEDIGEKAALCRCWRSSKFPYCDGSHGKHNNATGDNTGPVVVKK